MRWIAVFAMLVGSGGAASALDGKSLFGDHCGPCHQATGEGTPGLAPPLIKRTLWSKLGAKAPSYVTGVVIGGMSGPITVRGEVFDSGLAMPPKSDLADEEIAAIVSYLLTELNSANQTATVETVGAIRQKNLSRDALREIRGEF